MAEFIEERLSLSVRNGSSYGDDFLVEVTTTASGAEYRRLLHPFPVRRWHLQFTMARGDIGRTVKSLYDRCYKSFAGFRVYCEDDHSTAADGVSAPTMLDQTLTRVSAGVYQLVKRYGAGPELAIGRPARTLFKPVAGSVLIAVGGLAYSNGWTLESSTGRVTFFANISKAITAISKAASAVIDFGSAHTFTVGMRVHISGVAGMTQINGQRLTITAVTSNTITVALDTTGYSTYTSGGVANTQPQATETVTGGCLFDLPCRFDSAIEFAAIGGDVRDTGSVELVELLNP
ncbi:MAG TPA: DUF2460 domain-containing protein [Accumulibacter sp.]|nr:DUF2460 domain-containing protein [Accumulibacter sp.]